jgi:hypothetical protein
MAGKMVILLLMESMGMNMAYLDTKGWQDGSFTSDGHSPGSTAALTRQLARVWTWPQDILLRLNQHTYAAYLNAVDLTMFQDLDNLWYAFHVAQLLNSLLFNRVQGSDLKVSLVHDASKLGYTPLSSAADVKNLVKGIYSGPTSLFTRPFHRNRRTLSNELFWNKWLTVSSARHISSLTISVAYSLDQSSSCLPASKIYPSSAVSAP